MEDDAFPTPTFTPTPKRPLTPNVVTVERVPDFSSISSHAFDHPTSPDERRSRRDSFEQEMRDAKIVYEDTMHSTAPIPAAAIAAAAAVVVEERERRRGRSPGPRPLPGEARKPTDKVQKEADRHYHETVIVHKIAEEEICHELSQGN